MKAVIDRMEGEYALLLLGDKELKVDISIELLPEGSKEGSWLKVNFELDPEGEDKQREKISKLLTKLKNKNRK